MASFKLNISDPKTGKTYQKEVKDQQADPFIGLNIGQTVKGELFDLTGYEFQVTGGSDFCGFPMRRGILGVRKRIKLTGGVGFRNKRKELQRRKTVCGHKVNDSIVQINLKATKEGSKKLADVLSAKAEEGVEAPKEEAKKDAPKLSSKDEKGLEKPKASQSEKPKEEPKKEEKK